MSRSGPRRGKWYEKDQKPTYANRILEIVFDHGKLKVRQEVKFVTVEIISGRGHSRVSSPK